MAEACNQRGNVLYTEGKLSEAEDQYAVATRLRYDEPKYFSNLSAAQYEAGKYIEALDSVSVAWSLLSERQTVALSPTDPLAVKLATRFAKTSRHAYFDKPSFLIEENFENMANGHHDMHIHIEKFATQQHKVDDDARLFDMRLAWKQWRAVRDKYPPGEVWRYEKEVEDAQVRLRAIPIFKAPLDPTLDFYTFGRDEIQSLREGLHISRSPGAATQEKWCFLLGGSGDARHAFGTIIDFASAVAFNAAEAPHLHLTLVDIQSASLARVIMIFSLLQQIILARETRQTTKHLELHATLFYLYKGLVMPKYCSQILIDTARTLLSELRNEKHSLSRLLHITPTSLPSILEVLKYWATPLRKKMDVLLKQRLDSGALGNQLLDRILKAKAGRSRTTPKRNVTPSDDIYNDPEGEETMYKRTTAFLPPKELRSRHPCLANADPTYATDADTFFQEARKEVEKTWRPNSTLFDKSATEHYNFGMEGYTTAKPNMTDFKSFAAFTKRHLQPGKTPPAFCNGTTGFAVTSRLFDLLADSLRTMKDTLKIEIVVTEVIKGTAQLIAGDLGSRPKDFPLRYHRIWLSNVPDYTNGTLNNAVFIVPYLAPAGLLMSNCILNKLGWSTNSHYCYNYTPLLLPEDLPRILGCEFVNPGDPIRKDIKMKQLGIPPSLDKLVTKKELHAWLASVLLWILCNGTALPPPLKVELPNNLGAFIHLLAYLVHVGFPSHWIGDFAQSVVYDNLVTAAAPYLKPLPIPITEFPRTETPRRVHLAPWQADLQALLVPTHVALPFSLALPGNYPKEGDIRTYQATVRGVSFQREIAAFGSLTSHFSRTTAIIFYKPIPEVKADGIVALIPDILEGRPQHKDATMQIILGPEAVDILQGEVSWKMDRAWYKRMKREEWMMILYRTDTKSTVSEPQGTDRWTEILRFEGLTTCEDY